VRSIKAECLDRRPRLVGSRAHRFRVADSAIRSPNPPRKCRFDAG
jgi:hypothetical protein